MQHPTRTTADPHGLRCRLVRFITGLAVLAGFFSGAKAAPQSVEMTQAQLEQQLTDESGALHTFIRTLEQSIQSGNLQAVEAAVDQDAILTRATQRLDFPGDNTVRDLFFDSTKRAWADRGVTTDYRNSKFRFLRTRTLKGRAGLLFRSSNREGGINYALFTLFETEPGQYRIADIFVVGLNEFLSDTLHRTWLNIAAGFLGEDAAQIKGVNVEYVSHIGEIASLSRQINAGEYGETLKSAKTLPASLQRERTILLIRMDAAEHVSLAERNAVYADWLAAYPDEMELPLKLVHFYSSQARWDDAERVMRGLMNRLGSDAMLKTELGSIMYRRDQAKALVGKAGLSAR